MAETSKKVPMQPHFVGLWRIDPSGHRDDLPDRAIMFFGDRGFFMFVHGTDEDGEPLDDDATYIYELDGKEMLVASSDLRDLGSDEDTPDEVWLWDIDENDKLRLEIGGESVQLVPTTVGQLIEKGFQAKLFLAALMAIRSKGDSVIERAAFPFVADEEGQRILEEADWEAAEDRA